MQENEDTLAHVTMRVMEWLTHLVYLNVLWLLGVIAGGIFLGIGPATLALSKVLRAFIWGQKEVRVGASFWEYYRQYWKESNVFVWFFYAIYLFLWLDYKLILAYLPVIFPFYLLLVAIVVVVTCYFIVFNETLNGPFRKKLTDSLLLPWLFPLQSLGVAVVLIANVFVSLRWPVIGLLVGVSLPIMLFYRLLRKKYWVLKKG